MARPTALRGFRRNALRVALFLATACATAGAPRALLIGLNYQGGSAVTPLPGIRLDIEMMKQVARDLGIDDVRELWNENATLEGIRRAVENLGQGVAKDDLVLVYFSGHGTRVADSEGDEADGWDEVLVPYDAVPELGTLRNFLSDDEFANLLAAIPSDLVLGVIDACNSGTAAKSIGIAAKAYVYDGYGAPQARVQKTSAHASAGFSAPTATASANFIGIMASQDHEYANATQRGSVLTRSLLQAITEARPQARVTIGDLFDSVEEHVRHEMARLRKANPSLSQQPNLFTQNKGLILEQLSLAGTPSPGDRLAPPEDDPLIEKWREIAESVPRQVEFVVSRHVFPEHPGRDREASDHCDAGRYSDHLMSIEVVAPADGYLNLIDAPEGERRPIVLFPNKHQVDNAVKKGQVIAVPAPGSGWCLPATLPPGKRSEWNLVVALFSHQELNYFRDSASQRGPLTVLSPNARPFLPTGTPMYQAAGSKLLLIESGGPQQR